MSFLENYLDSVSQLPDEVRQNFILLRHLDSRSQDLLIRAEAETEGYLDSLRKGRDAEKQGTNGGGVAAGDEVIVDTDREQEASINEDLRACLALADEKVNIAITTYDLVDKHIRKLDADLKKFEQELAAAGRLPSQMAAGRGRGAPPVAAAGTYTGSAADVAVQQAHELIGATKAQKAAARGRTGRGRGTTRGRGRSPAPVAAAAAAAASGLAPAYGLGGPFIPQPFAEDMPIDPHEPRYCICNNVSFGEMVACENRTCQREWFHFDCVGLTSKPKGKWYCQECKESMRKNSIYQQ